MDYLPIRGRERVPGTCDAIPPPLEWASVARGLVDDGDDLQVLQVQGNSMRDAFVNDGDLVMLKPKPTAQNGEMIVVWCKSLQTTMLKYYHRENGHVRLLPVNPALACAPT